MSTSYERNKKRLESVAVDFCEEGTIFTPFTLIEEMLDKLPTSLWADGNLKWLDPACGRGAFLYAIKERLMKAGHSEKHIVENMLYGVDISEKNIALTRGVLCGKVEYNTINNIACDDSLTREWGMKFDVVVGNPPYQDPVSPTKKLWEDFLKKSFDLVNTNGVVALIHPLNWMSNKNNMLHDYFSTKTPTWVNIKECEKYFPGVSTMIGYEIILNTPNISNQLTQVQTISGIYNIDFSTTQLLPNDVNNTVMSILSKTLRKELSFVRSSETGTAKIQKDVPSGTHTYPVFRGWSQKQGIMWGYSQTPHSLHGKWKVIFQEFSTDNMGFFVEQNAATENGYMMECSSQIHACTLREVMISKLYQFLIKQLKHTRTIRPHILNNLPIVDLSRSWNDNELYEHFGLTQEEIKLIEGTIT